jgi:hypothetical protein
MPHFCVRAPDYLQISPCPVPHYEIMSGCLERILSSPADGEQLVGEPHVAFTPPSIQASHIRGLFLGLCLTWHHQSSKHETSSIPRRRRNTTSSHTPANWQWVEDERNFSGPSTIPSPFVTAPSSTQDSRTKHARKLSISSTVSSSSRRVSWSTRRRNSLSVTPTLLEPPSPGPIRSPKNLTSPRTKAHVISPVAQQVLKYIDSIPPCPGEEWVHAVPEVVCRWQGCGKLCANEGFYKHHVSEHVKTFTNQEWVNPASVNRFTADFRIECQWEVNGNLCRALMRPNASGIGSHINTHERVNEVRCTLCRHVAAKPRQHWAPRGEALFDWKDLV